MDDFAFPTQAALSSDQRSRSFTPLSCACESLIPLNECKCQRSKPAISLTGCDCHSCSPSAFTVNSGFNIRSVSVDFSTGSKAITHLNQAHKQQLVWCTKCQICELYMNPQLDEFLSKEGYSKHKVCACIKQNKSLDDCEWKTLTHSISCGNCDRINKKIRHVRTGNSDSSIMYTAGDMTDMTEECKYLQKYDIDSLSSQNYDTRHCIACSVNKTERVNDSQTFEIMETDDMPGLQICELNSTKTSDESKIISSAINRDPNCNDIPVKSMEIAGSMNTLHICEFDTDDKLHICEHNEMPDAISKLDIREPMEISDLLNTPDVREATMKEIALRPKENSYSTEKFIKCDPNCKGLSDMSGEMVNVANTLHICEPSIKVSSVRPKVMKDEMGTIQIREQNSAAAIYPFKSTEMTDQIRGQNSAICPFKSRKLRDRINTMHICERNCKGASAKPIEARDIINTLHICGPSITRTSGRVKEMKDETKTVQVLEPTCVVSASKSKNMKCELNAKYICEQNSREMPNKTINDITGTLNTLHICDRICKKTPVNQIKIKDTTKTLHICEPNCIGTPLVQYICKPTTDSYGQLCIRSHDVKQRQMNIQALADTQTALPTYSHFCRVCKPQIKEKGDYRQHVSNNSRNVSRYPNLCTCERKRHNKSTKGVVFQGEDEIIKETIEDNSSEPLLSEDVVWIKKETIESQSEVKTKSLGKSDKTRTNKESRRIVILTLLTLIGSLLNPLCGPAVIYFLIRSRRAWSKRRYHSAYKFSYQAAGLAIIGIIVTITGLVLFKTTIMTQRHTDTTPTSQHHMTTSSENQDMSHIRNAGERFLDTLIGRHSSRIPEAMKQTPSGSRHFKRTTSPRHLYTKIRHNTHRLGNIHISDFDRFLADVTPTKTTETTKAKHFNEFLNKDVARRKPQLTFRNRTMSIYFDPKTNHTIIVNIPDFMQHY